MPRPLSRADGCPGARLESPRRAPLVVEALGYLGGVIAIVAGVVAVDQLWPGIPTGAELAFAAAGTVALGAVAALMRTDGEPALGCIPQRPLAALDREPGGIHGRARGPGLGP